MQACGRRRVVDGEASALWCTEIERCCAARNDIWQEMASVYGTRMEGERKVQELEEALVDRQMSKAALEQELSRLQSLLADMPLSQRIYNGIITSAIATDLPKWRLTDAGGAAIGRVFVRPSGKPLSDGVDGIFTYEGFNTVFLGEALQVAKRLLLLQWRLQRKSHP